MKINTANQNTGTSKNRLFFPVIFLILPLLFSCASGGGAKAEEYFSLGMAYYEMAMNNNNNAANRDRYFQEAERWLTRARRADKTMTASDYNLGRLAYENGRYGDAAKHFERILAKDSDNVMALKAAAYSRIRNGDLTRAEAHYSRVLVLVPESADDGYNYALVLYGLKKYEESEEVLSKYHYALEENAQSMLLYARAQKAQDKVEAVDSYAKWARTVTAASAQGLYEYAQVLEYAGLYARAVEQYRAAAAAITSDTGNLKKSAVIFEEARLLLSADPDNSEGIQRLNAAITEGFSDQMDLRALLTDDRIRNSNKDEIRRILGTL